MDRSKTDKLLVAGKILVITLKVILGLATVGLAAAIPAIFFSRSHVADALAPGYSLPAALATITGGLLLGIAMLAAAFRFVQLLGRIIGTVGEGDPFVPENADRLSRMGWITVGLQLAAIPMTAFASILGQYFPETHIEIDAGVSLNGVVLAIVLFILARVFRQGAAMREDLEGTV